MNKTSADLITEIGELVKGVWAYKEDPENLSKVLNDIAVLSWALALWQTKYEESERMMKAELDLDKANLTQQFVNSGDAVNKAEIRVTIQLSDKRKEYNKTASNLEKVKIMTKATEKVMDSVRSRLSLIKENVKNG